MTTTKQKILAAATELFAQKGFSGASIDDIAQQADVHKSLIYHHIGNKEALWVAVKHQLISRIVPDTDLTQFQTLADFLQFIITTRIKVYGADPRIGRLLKWQTLEENPQELLSDHSIAPANWTTAIKHLQDLGQVTKQYPARLIMLFIHSTVSATVLDHLPMLEKDGDKKRYTKMLMDILQQSFST